MMTRPLSDLQNDWEAIYGYCKEYNEPVYLAETGKDGLVLMSQASYESRIEELQTTITVLEAEADYRKDGISYTWEEVDRMAREAIYGDTEAAA